MDTNKGGRPRDGEQAKTAPLSMRIEPSLRAQIVEAAQARDVSVTREVERRLRESFGDSSASLRHDLLAKAREAAAAKGVAVQQEIEFRLETSFREDAASEPTRRLTRLIVALLERIEQRSKNRWHEDPLTWKIARAGILRLLHESNPEPDLGMPQEMAHIRAEIKSEKRKLHEAVEALEAVRKAHPEIDEWGVAPLKLRDEMVPTEPAVWEELVRLNKISIACAKRVDELEARDRELGGPWRDELGTAANIGFEAAHDTMKALLWLSEKHDRSEE